MVLALVLLNASATTRVRSRRWFNNVVKPTTGTPCPTLQRMMARVRLCATLHRHSVIHIAPCRGGWGGGPRPPFCQVITQKKPKFCLQTVKSNILLSQNAGNAISETLDVHNFRGGGGMPPDPYIAGLGLRPPTTAMRSTSPPLPWKPTKLWTNGLGKPLFISYDMRGIFCPQAYKLQRSWTLETKQKNPFQVSMHGRPSGQSTNTRHNIQNHCIDLMTLYPLLHVKQLLLMTTSVSDGNSDYWFVEAVGTASCFHSLSGR